MKTELFCYDLLKVRKLRARKTLSQASYLVADIERTLVDRLGSNLSKVKKVLVVGCPGGIVENYLNDKGVKFDTFDPFLESVFKSHQLPFQKAFYDVVLDGFVFHWINDPLMYMTEVHRVLRPGGLYLSGFLGGSTLTELRQVLLDIDVMLYKGAFGRVSPMIKPEAATRILQATQFNNPVVDHEEIGVAYQDLKELVQDLRFMGESNALKDQRGIRYSKYYLEKAHKYYQTLFPASPQTIMATFDFVFMTGWRSL